MTSLNKALWLALLGLSVSAAGAFAAPGRMPGGMGGDMIATIDINKDGKATREEMTKKARENFKKADTNKDSTLSRDELVSHMKNQPHPLDADKDGTVSKKEFMAPASAHFTKVDTDNNGAISKKEFAAGPEKVFACLDKDKNGSLAGNELKRPRMGMGGKGGMDRQRMGNRKGSGEGQGAGQNAGKNNADKTKGAGKQGPLAMIDTDGNGSVNEAEWVAMAGKRFDRMDKNKDNSIEKSEVRGQNKDGACESM